MKVFVVSVECFTVLLHFSLTGSLQCFACFAGQVLAPIRCREGLASFACKHHGLRNDSTQGVGTPFQDTHQKKGLRAPVYMRDTAPTERLWEAGNAPWLYAVQVQHHELGHLANEV